MSRPASAGSSARLSSVGSSSVRTVSCFSSKRPRIPSSSRRISAFTSVGMRRAPSKPAPPARVSRLKRGPPAGDSQIRPAGKTRPPPPPQPGCPRPPPPRRPPAPATTRGAFPLRGRAPRRTPPLPPPPSLHPWWPRTGRRARVAATGSLLFPIRGHEPEPDAPHGVEQLELRGLLQFAAKIAHMDVHHVALGVEVEIPHLFEQLGAPDHFLRPEQEMLEQLEFLRRELELLALDLDLVLQAVELDRPIAEELGAARADRKRVG